MPYIQVDNGVRLFYEDWGVGPVVLFVHGWSFDHTVWQYQTSRMVNNFRTIVLDLRGHGASDKPNSAYNYREYARDLRNFILALNLHNVTLVGWSLGSAICLEYLLLFGDRVTKFVSVGGAIPKFVNGDGWHYGVSEGYTTTIIEELLYQSPEYYEKFANNLFVNKSVGDATKKWMWTISMKASIPALIRTMFELEKADFRQYIPYIKIPFGLFNGEKDAITTPEAAEWIAMNNPNTTLVLFKNSGHTPFIEEIDRFTNELIRFILA